MKVGLPAAICALVEDLPPPLWMGQPVVWKKKDRERWLKAFEAVLDLVYDTSEPESKVSATQISTAYPLQR